MFIPSNNNIFLVNSNEIVLNENGYYEFYFYGMIQELSPGSSVPNIALNISNIPLFQIELIQGMESTYFSQSCFKLCHSGDVIIVDFQKDSGTDAQVTGVYLIIKRFSFPIS